MSGVGDYMARACNAPLLTPKQEILLGRQVQNGRAPEATDKQRRMGARAKERLILSNMRMVVNIARSYYSRCKTLALEDLFQEGALGLSRAAELFDPTRGYKFSTYSHRWIQHYITRAINEKDRIIRIPVNVGDAIYRFNKVLQTAGPDPDYHEAANLARANLAKVQQGLLMRSVATLDSRYDGEEGGMIQAVAADPPEQSFIEELGFDAQHLQRCLLQLPPMEREFLQCRYGLLGRKKASVEAIGKRYGMSRYRASNVKNRALERLRQILETLPG